MIAQQALSSIQTISSKRSRLPKNDSRIEKKSTINSRTLARSQRQLKLYFMTVQYSCDLTDMPRDGLLKTFHHSLALSRLSSDTGTEDARHLGHISWCHCDGCSASTLFTCSSDLFLLLGLFSGLIINAQGRC